MSSQKHSTIDSLGQSLQTATRAYDALATLVSLGQLRLWHKKISQKICGDSAQNLRILEVNPKTASLLLKINENNHGYEIYAQEENYAFFLALQDLIEAKKVKTNDKIHAKFGNPTNLNYGASTFDAVIMTFGLRFLKQRKAFYKEAQRVLKPGGRLFLMEIGRPREYLTSPKIAQKKTTLRKILSQIQKPRSKLMSSFPAEKELIAELMEAGFQNVQTEPSVFGLTTLYEAKTAQ